MQYLHMQVHTYEAQLTPQEIYAYYAPRLTAQGFSPGMPSEYCGQTPACWQSWEVFLQPTGALHPQHAAAGRA
ncbi:MAG: hypothetical protein M0Z66_05045 [Thermaerobacter sp.]|nr:hypothetical protein [Thermaerobacter sp.]